MKLGEYFALLDAAGELVTDESGTPFLVKTPGPHFESNARNADRRVIVVEITQVKRLEVQTHG